MSVSEDDNIVIYNMFNLLSFLSQLIINGQMSIFADY